MKEIIQKVKDESFINHHGSIDFGGTSYAILETLKKADTELQRRIEEQERLNNSDSTHVTWKEATTREIQQAETYNTGSETYTHGEDDGHHSSVRRTSSSTKPSRGPRGLIVNV